MKKETEQFHSDDTDEGRGQGRLIGIWNERQGRGGRGDGKRGGGEGGSTDNKGRGREDCLASICLRQVVPLFHLYM